MDRLDRRTAISNENKFLKALNGIFKTNSKYKEVKQRTSPHTPMKKYKLKNNFKGLKKGTQFYLVAESEFIGIKEFVLRTADLSIRIAINESELQKNFALLDRFR